ncbi:MAG: MarR family winged helix-turn-helix transcriptional regulator [Kiloniellaceae bacterium]
MSISESNRSASLSEDDPNDESTPGAESRALASVEEPAETAGATKTDPRPIMLDEQIGLLIRRAHQRATAIFAMALAGARLTPAQYFAMARLRERGELSQNFLGRLSAMDPATIQGVIKRLRDRGFIRRRPDPSDRRRMILSLTPAGVATVDNLSEAVNGASTHLMAALAADEQMQLLSLLKLIV